MGLVSATTVSRELAELEPQFFQGREHPDDRALTEIFLVRFHDQVLDSTPENLCFILDQGYLGALDVAEQVDGFEAVLLDEAAEAGRRNLDKRPPADWSLPNRKWSCTVNSMMSVPYPIATASIVNWQSFRLRFSSRSGKSTGFASTTM